MNQTRDKSVDLKELDLLEEELNELDIDDGDTYLPISTRVAINPRYPNPNTKNMNAQTEQGGNKGNRLIGGPSPSLSPTPHHTPLSPPCIPPQGPLRRAVSGSHPERESERENENFRHGGIIRRAVSLGSNDTPTNPSLSPSPSLSTDPQGSNVGYPVLYRDEVKLPPPSSDPHCLSERIQAVDGIDSRGGDEREDEEREREKEEEEEEEEEEDDDIPLDPESQAMLDAIEREVEREEYETVRDSLMKESKQAFVETGLDLSLVGQLLDETRENIDKEEKGREREREKKEEEEDDGEKERVKEREKERRREREKERERETTHPTSPPQ